MPVLRAPRNRKERQLRMAGDSSASIAWQMYELASIHVLGYGKTRLTRLLDESRKNYAQVNGWAKEGGMEYAFSQICKCAKLALREDLEVIDSTVEGWDEYAADFDARRKNGEPREDVRGPGKARPAHRPGERGNLRAVPFRGHGERPAGCHEMEDLKMDKYISTKLIEAEPAYRASDGLGHTIITNDPAKVFPNYSSVEDGYRVRYPDGYESWCPKDTFERNCLPLTPNSEPNGPAQHQPENGGRFHFGDLDRNPREQDDRRAGRPEERL